ncbi:MAG TPA: hypothetical protein VL728_19565 [Cyclobacteriaceae bacterium]|jgi:hypothetical protein|nr:hypothetical protein [Cyclobacteriaceae bacterium]
MESFAFKIIIVGLIVMLAAFVGIIMMLAARYGRKSLTDEKRFKEQDNLIKVQDEIIESDEKLISLLKSRREAGEIES